jgi:hypothetical protein
VSRQLVSRIELGHADGVPLGTLRRVVGGLGMTLQLVPRWQGGDLDRLLAARHSALHESVAAVLADLPGWETRPEVTFSIYGERGAIDILGWHEQTRTLLVIELKTEIVDVGELLATLDRKVRLAPRIARDQGRASEHVSAWVVLADSTTNRRRVSAHRTVLRSALPDDGRRVDAWLREPRGRLAALSFWSSSRHPGTTVRPAPVRRVAGPSARPQTDEPARMEPGGPARPPR